jgi:hypothetical protein
MLRSGAPSAIPCCARCVIIHLRGENFCGGILLGPSFLTVSLLSRKVSHPKPWLSSFRVLYSASCVMFMSPLWHTCCSPTFTHTPASLSAMGTSLPSSVHPDKSCHRKMRHSMLSGPTNDDSKTHQSSPTYFLTVGFQRKYGFPSHLSRGEMINCRQ